MENKIKISVIIPVYNCEKYLKQCIRSVLDQTIRNFEIICVDDGSTDRSKEIIRNLQAEDKRVALYCQKNEGAGRARNLALQKAKGDYVAFLDADDYYKDTNALELMYEACEKKNVLACLCARRCVVSENERFEELIQEKYIDRVLEYKDFQMDYFFQNFLFYRKLLNEKDISFPPYRRYQDPPFLAKTLFAAGKFTVADTCLYCYRLSDGNQKFNRKKTEDLLKGILDNLKFSVQNNLDILFHNTAERVEKDIVKIIYENSSSDDLSILELLLEINKIISEKEHQPDYIIKPLRLLLFNFRSYEKKLLNYVESQNQIAIYGAGNYACNFLRFLKQNGLLHKVEFAIVSESPDYFRRIENIPVISLQESLKLKRNLEVIITAGQKNTKEIIKMLEDHGHKKYKVLNDLFWEFRILEDFGG